MNRIQPLLRRRFVLLLAVLGVTSLLPLTRQPAFAEYCGTGFAQIFYSDSSDTTVVGHCNRDCTGTTRCTGTKTAYSSVAFYQCCS
jgi:hypothetical protein